VDARLRNALAAGHTIVTGNVRLARSVRLELADEQAARGAGVWTPPTIVAWRDWLSRLHEEVRWTSSGSARALLNAAQEQRVWEQIVAEDAAGDLIGAAATARQARAAWGLLHAWRLPDPGQAPLASEEVRAFARWMRSYHQRCRDQAWLDGARLPDALRVAIGASIIAPPVGILLLGFEHITPQQRAFLRALEERGARVEASCGPRNEANARRLELATVEDELMTSARRARELLATGAAGRIGILVPDLAARRETVQRIFDDVLVPGAGLPWRGVTRRPFNLASGPPLADHAIVRSARAVLALLAGTIALADLSRILRSPFLAGGVSRGPQRATFDAWLREQGVVELDFERFPRHLAVFTESRRSHPADVALHSLFERASVALPEAGTRYSLDVWADAMSRCLQAFGWPGERRLTVVEQATVAAFQATVARFASLELVQGPLDARGALRQLTALLGREPFQVDNPEAPVQVLDLAEAYGLGFDELWITGLDDERWPPPADPNPFIPLEWQRRHELPGAAPEGELERARRITHRLLSSSPSVIVSHALHDGDRSRGPSPLVRALPPIDVAELALADATGLHVAPFAASSLEALRDERAPPLAPAEIARGGTRVLKLQAACPFRAYGELRLHATALASASPALEARLRGIRVHGALERLWRRLGSLTALRALDDAGVASVVAEAVEDTLAAVELEHMLVLSPRRRGVESARLTRTLQAWLALERERADFAVQALEAQGTVKLGGMELGTRADRIDRLVNDALVIIDYKSGAERRAPGAWSGSRPDEPQLPLYALAETGPLAGVFIAHVRPGRQGFSGAARVAGIVPGVGGDAEQGDEPRFHELRAHWHESLGRLAADYASGDARVDPKHGWQTCRSCELGLLCRVAELASVAEADDV
jgi:probable DNA repair protein